MLNSLNSNSPPLRETTPEPLQVPEETGRIEAMLKSLETEEDSLFVSTSAQVADDSITSRSNSGSNTPMPVKSHEDDDQSIRRLKALDMRVTQVATNFISMFVNFWYDTKAPLDRFFYNQSSFIPKTRVFLFIALGFFLSVVGIWVSEDEYAQGGQVIHQNEIVQVNIGFDQVGCTIAGVGRVLSNMTGEILPGRITGILGQSGSGKTSFAYALLGR